MKFLLFFVLSVLTFISTNGQPAFVIKKSDYLKLLKKRSLTFKNPKDSIILSALSAFKSQKAKMLFETEKGKVYQLPLDNMRCLVPDFKSNMPVVRGFSPELNNEPKIKSVPIHNPLFRNGSKSRKVKKYPRK